AGILSFRPASVHQSWPHSRLLLLLLRTRASPRRPLALRRSTRGPHFRPVARTSVPTRRSSPPSTPCVRPSSLHPPRSSANSTNLPTIVTTTTTTPTTRMRRRTSLAATY